MATAGNLRQRKKSASKASSETKDTVVAADETEALLLKPDDDEDDDDEDDHHHHHNDGYILTPLVQRSVLLRLDVAPFLIGYLCLMYVDRNNTVGSNDNGNDEQQQQQQKATSEGNILLQPVTWLFALMILSHMMLVLMQQWNVHIRSLVGYKRASQEVIHVTNSSKSNTTTTTNKAEAVIASWTHCLVEGGSTAGAQGGGGGSKSSSSSADKPASADTSAGAGIAPVVVVEMQAMPNTKLQSNVAIVNFHDITFRCPTLSKSLDQDVMLWKKHSAGQVGTKDAAAAKTKMRTKLSFHRVRFPVNLPVSFYGKWKGHSTLDSVVQCQHLYGTNATILELPTFVELLAEQVVAPFFLFQIFCVALWSLDEYWYYAIFTLLALLSFESTVAYNRQQGLQRLRNASRRNNHRIWVHRTGFSPQTASSSSSSSWIRITAQEIVPGDVVSLSSEPEASGRGFESSRSKTPQHNTVPADVLLLKGNAVVDEALLTGESIPQIKVPFDPSSSSSSTTNTNNAKIEDRLDIQDHKEAVLFGGTVLLTAEFGISNQDGGDPTTAKSNDSTKTKDDEDISSPPDGGVVGVVLRTGFETAQGSLLRTIAHSSKSVDGVHTLDTFVFIFMLLCCAFASASLVLRDGWEDVTRNRFRLVLHVVIIITSVVPPELPMELSLAVTNSVTDLMKRCQVFCTEHYRIPWAGLVDVCCFDKTGTITSDKMRLKGIRLFANDDLEHLDEENALVKPGENDPEILPWPVVRVMAGCHSLALRVSRGNASFGSHVIGDPLEQAVLKDTGYQLVGNNMLIPLQPVPGRPKSISIIHRFAFASQLKRMTVLVTEENSATDSNTPIWALTKGAPETIYTLLSPESVPSDYDDIYTYHMSRGRRVLAMAYRSLGAGRSLRSLKEMGREKIEAGLTFAGFLVLDCPLKPDSKSVISEIRKSDHRVVMITGDAVLTAAEVSRQVGIVPTSRDGQKHVTYRLQELEGAEAKSHDPLSRFAFVPLLSKKKSPESVVAVSNNIVKLQAMMHEGSASFCLTGDMLAKVAAAALNTGVMDKRVANMSEKSTLLHPHAQSVLKELVKVISVFARHAPHQKEAVVAAFNLSGHYTLYCGDGTNDTPSLKRAHVGISIISAPEAETKQRKANASLSRIKAEKRKAQKKGKKAAGSGSSKRSMEESLRLLREAQEEIDQIELGDASMASPFTSRQVSIVCCKNVIQQGRCTLVTMLQIYKILGINCLVNAMVLSTLSIHGVKQGDRQLTVLGTVVAALFFFVTRAKPLETLSSARPPSSVLCLHALLSIALQFAIHFATILLACTAALSFVDPFDPSLVADGPFNPNVLNTCTFMLTVLATINTFAVNYRGRPFTENLQENTLLMRSLVACYFSLFLCAFEAFPPLNDLLQLSSFPVITEVDVESFGSASADTSFVGQELINSLLQQVDFPTFMVLLMVVDTLLSFFVEKVLVRTFEG